MHDFLSLSELAKLEVVGKDNPVHIPFPIELFKKVTFYM